MLENILNDLFNVFRFDTCENIREALDILLLAMERHISQKLIQISGSASLYYVAKSEAVKRDLNLRVKRKILSTLLNGMLEHREDPTMMRNGCLTLCQFQIPQDVLFDYERLVRILLHCVSEHTDEQNNFIQRAGIFLLNSLACQVDGQQKRLVGRLGAIEKMLFIIAEKLAAGICDDVMETAWSTMWNVTDETPGNCERFLNGNGMQLFLLCKEKFPEKQDLLRQDTATALKGQGHEIFDLIFVPKATCAPRLNGFANFYRFRYSITKLGYSRSQRHAILALGTGNPHCQLFKIRYCYWICKYN